MLQNKSLIVFDMDGTIFDTLKDLNASVNYALTKNNYPLRDIEHTRRSIGNGVAMLVKRSVPENTSEEDYKKTLKDFENHYSKHSFDHTSPYKGFYEVLKELKVKGYKLAVATNKLESVAKDLVNKYYPNIFDTICGDDGIRNKKPAPDQIIEICKRLSIKDKSQILYLGDSEVDYEFAINSGVDVLLVSYGYRTIDELNNKIKTPFKYIDNIRELIKKSA